MNPFSQQKIPSAMLNLQVFSRDIPGMATYAGKNCHRHPPAEPGCPPDMPACTGKGPFRTPAFPYLKLSSNNRWCLDVVMLHLPSLTTRSPLTIETTVS